MNFVLYFRSMNVKSLIIILLFFCVQAEARLADLELKNCDNILRDSLGELVRFAYRKDIANFPLGPDSMRRDELNIYPQVGQLKIPFIRSDGSKSTGTAFFVKDVSGRRTLRTAAHDFINEKTGKLYGPLDEYDFELGDRKYGIESVKCGMDVGKDLENLYLDQCEVTLKEDIVDGIEPLELDYDFLKTKSGKSKNYEYELVGFHGFPPNWRGFRTINKCGYVYSRFKEHDLNHRYADQIFSAQCNSSAGMSGSPLIQNGKAVGLVVSAGEPADYKKGEPIRGDNGVIAPLPVDKLNIVINHENESDYL